MQTGSWPISPDAEEYAVTFDSGRQSRVLVIPALFDEGNKLRHFTIEAMRAMDERGIDSMLPDLPGTNESIAPLSDQTIVRWRAAMVEAGKHFRATHVLAIRGGALVTPPHRPCIAYAHANGAGLLRGLLRARVIADKEAGIETTRETLLEIGRHEGLVLSGYAISPEMVQQLEVAEYTPGDIAPIKQSAVGGSALWLRAEPAHDPLQSKLLAHVVAERMK